jgi:hypothetical protein
MTPQALGTMRALQALNLPAGVLRKVAIGAGGKPDFSRLSDLEFDDLTLRLRRLRPEYYDDDGLLKQEIREGGSARP